MLKLKLSIGGDNSSNFNMKRRITALPFNCSLFYNVSEVMFNFEVITTTNPDIMLKKATSLSSIKI